MKLLYTIALTFFSGLLLQAQIDTTKVATTQKDSTKLALNMDAIYSRPFMKAGKLPISIGGYVEANTSYFATDGITEGMSFQIPRMTLFVSSTINNRIKFLSEIEFEEGGKEINIEFASLDVEFNPLFNFRGGIIMNPIGSFNQNHDGPKWEFIDRPISSTTIIPSTWSNVGFGFFGKHSKDNLVWAYEGYFSNGFDDKIISNTQNRTWLPASKENAERFEESFNGEPMITAKTALKHRKIGEFGISWMGGVYNKFREDGIAIDKKRRVDLLALDFNTRLSNWKTYINAEWVWAFIDVPDTYSQQFGSQQKGGFLDIVQPILRREVLGWKNSTLNIAFRIEYADYNVGKFNETNENIYDDVFAFTPGISLRPSSQTVFRLNYRYIMETDIFGNDPSKTAGIQFGFSSYF
ncbi:MAG: hypothetical protein ACI7YS_07150 [Flavobacterium sp.]